MKQFLLLFFLIPVAIFAQIGSVKMDVRSLPPLPTSDYDVQKFLAAHAGSQSLSDYQKEWFYWTNYSRINPRRFWDSVVGPFIKVYPELQSSYTTSLKKDLYKANTLPLLRPNAALIQAAQEHSNALASKKASPSHTSPNGVTFQVRMEKAKIQTCAGENISFGPKNAVLGLILLYIDQGVPDVGHRLSLLTPSFTEMGIGASPYPNSYFLSVQDFACSQPR